MKILNVITLEVRREGETIEYKGKGKFKDTLECIVIEDNGSFYNIITDVTYNRRNFISPNASVQWKIMSTIFNGESVDISENECLLSLVNEYYDKRKEEEKDACTLNILNVKESKELFEDNKLYKSFRIEYEYMSKKYLSTLETVSVYNEEYEDYDEDDFCGNTIHAGTYFIFDGFKLKVDIVNREWIDIEDKDRLEILKDYILYEYLNVTKYQKYKEEYPYIEAK